MIYHCCDDSRRRAALEAQTTKVFNGIDFLEVVDNPTDPDDLRQRTLLVHFVLPLDPGQLTVQNVRILGGERIRQLDPSQLALQKFRTSGGERFGNMTIKQVSEEISASPPGDPKVLVVEVDRPGDFSTYRLSLVDTADPTRPPKNFDPVLSQVDFSFKVGCESGFDCQTSDTCPPPARSEIDISYLAKDYSSFRQLMLDRMAKIMPQWQDRYPADLGIVLLEILAYVGDYLSYQQDAVATEAYLGTARRRTSVRRHVRLVDYPMHDGRNARTWVAFQAGSGISGVTLKKGECSRLLTRTSQPNVIMKAGSTNYEQALSEKPQAFELMQDLALFTELNSLTFYTWGSRDCCLPAGATSAYLGGALPNLKPGRVLILQEVLGPKTGIPGDADPAHVHVVRLISVVAETDPIGSWFDDQKTFNPITVMRVEWAAEDALPFPLCISSSSDQGYFTDVSIALGNVALADHGLTISDEPLEEVPDPNPALALAPGPAGDPCIQGKDACQPDAPVPSSSRYRPRLLKEPLTFADSYAVAAPANSALDKRELSDLLPEISLLPEGDPNEWSPQRELLKSHAESREFVVETENDGSAYLRFGDGVLGARPAPGTVFHANYRIGNGIAGNIGSNSLFHFVTDDPVVLSGGTVMAITNPMAASGGLDPELLEQVRQRAPYAFRTQERAVTEQDYADMAQRCDSSLQRAQATFRWTGSWRTAFIAADRKGGAIADKTFRDGLKSCMDRYRMAGQDVDVEPPAFVSLEIAIDICVKPDYFASDVKAALLNLLSNRTLPDGRLGAFHPDNFSFGQTVYLSTIYQLVQQSDGVESAHVTTFQRQGIKSDVGILTGKLELARLEIARLDNDPNFPEHGILTLNMHGGR